MLEYTFVSVAVILILTSGGDKYLLSLTNLSFLWGPFTNIMHWWINCFKTRTTLSNRVDPSCSLGGSWISPKSRSGLLTHLPPLSSRCLGYLLVPRKTPDRWWWLKLRALQKQKPFSTSVQIPSKVREQISDVTAGESRALFRISATSEQL